MKDILETSHEIWAASQLLPHEGIEDGVARIVEILRPTHAREVALEVALRDAISTYGPKECVIVTSERQEAWVAALALDPLVAKAHLDLRANNAKGETL